MKYTIWITIILFLTACGSGENPPKASENFKTDHYVSQTDENNHTIIEDLNQSLTFVNSEQGCKALHGKNEDALNTAESFCAGLVFYGFDDWRVPTLEEIQNNSKGMDSEALIPYFTFPECKRITGIKDDGSLGAINTHNVSPRFEEVPLSLPAGVRCVR
jgi:hypothetical protein